MKKIIIKGEDLARIPLWKTLGKPKDDEEIVLYQLEDGESFPVDKPVKPATAEDIIKILNKAAEEINIGQSTTYDGFDITKDRKNFIAKIRKHIRKQFSV